MPIRNVVINTVISSPEVIRFTAWVPILLQYTMEESIDIKIIPICPKVYSKGVSRQTVSYNSTVTWIVYCVFPLINTTVTIYVPELKISCFKTPAASVVEPALIRMVSHILLISEESFGLKTPNFTQTHSLVIIIKETFRIIIPCDFSYVIRHTDSYVVTKRFVSQSKLISPTQ